MATNEAIIWAKKMILIGSEGTERGSWYKPATKLTLFPKTWGTLTPQYEFINDESGHGYIFDTFTVRNVWASTELNLTGNVSYDNIRRLIEAITGDEVDKPAKKKYVVKNSNMHNSFVALEVSWDFVGNGDIDIKEAPYCVLSEFELKAEPNQFVNYTAKFLWSVAKAITGTNVSNIKTKMDDLLKKEKSSNLVDFSQIKLFYAKTTDVTNLEEFIKKTKADPSAWTKIDPLIVSSLDLTVNKNVEKVGQLGSHNTAYVNKQFWFGGTIEYVKKLQNQLNFDDLVNKELMLRVVFEKWGTEVCSFVFWKVFMKEYTETDAVSEIEKATISFAWAFTKNEEETFSIYTDGLGSAES